MSTAPECQDRPRDAGVREGERKTAYRLKPCPNCGSEDIRWCDISVRPHCGDCNLWGFINFGSREDAARQWNDRSVQRGQPADRNAAAAMRGVRVTGDPEGAVRKLVGTSIDAANELAAWQSGHASQPVIAALRAALSRFHVEEEAE